MVTPYPLGVMAKDLDCRIDDPDGVWKRARASSGKRTPFHVDGGNGTLPKLEGFQLRPNPLAY